MMDVDTNYFNADFARRLMPKINKELKEKIEDYIKDSAKVGYDYIRYDVPVKDVIYIEEYFEELGFEVERKDVDYKNKITTILIKW